ncbi:OsmC family protein [Phenylobacterium montanum]|uniref:OsmC family protein n=1 Tax=Phenylobacterium montanum TaxID=2823693 RepID=A0A975FW34_9CAUL|nr:OsmC family protein [Caulobacter sp. S6]QUD86548.1 OsmC family protein [Caulobacter sp. S6]
MAHGQHRYEVRVEWTGDRGEGTASYRAYDRDHVISAPGKPAIPGSSDPAFRGDAARWNPEELLVASVSACHKLWYLHLCSEAGIAVRAYVDAAEGLMVEDEKGGHFTSVTLRPEILIRAGDDAALAERLHHRAHELCFIANSVNFPIACEPVIRSA